MVMKKKGPLVGKNTACLTRQIGLPEMFLDLRIMGLEEVAKCGEITSKNKGLIFRFLNHISAEVSEGRLTFYTHKLRKLAAWLQKDFDTVTEEDLRSLLTFLSKGKARQDGRRYSQGTLHGYKVTLKRFYRWLEGEDEEYPRKVRWIKTSGDTTRIQEPEQLLSYEEVLEMIRHARSPRDKAMVSFLYESGARISEVLSMKIKHLEFTPAMVRATLPVSKTRPRIIPLVSCKQHLATWMNYHPLKDDPDAPLWTNLKQDGSSPLLSSTVNNILKGIASAAGIKKRVYPHLFRACSITHKQGSNWPEQAVKLFHGLSKDSKVMRNYSHLSYGNLEQIQMSMNGLPVEETAKLNRGIKCPGCGRENPLHIEMCACGLPTEMKFIPGDNVSMMSDIEARVERKMQEFIENRQVYDRLMERFMNALLEKTRESPELLRFVNEIGRGLGEERPRIRAYSARQAYN